MSGEVKKLEIKENIENNIECWMEDRNENFRGASFDYCYNYFYSFRNNPENLCKGENLYKSCFHLGFYLASWGMFRGSSYLMQYSIEFYKPIIKLISEDGKELWDIDVDKYNEKNIQLIKDFSEKLKCTIIKFREENEQIEKKKIHVTNTQLTKIMLGVFANIPAFDTRFCNAIGIWAINKKNLEEIRDIYYIDNKEYLDKKKKDTKTFTIDKIPPTNYTIAKLIDMYGFTEGGK